MRITWNDLSIQSLSNLLKFSHMNLPKGEHLEQSYKKSHNVKVYNIFFPWQLFTLANIIISSYLAALYTQGSLFIQSKLGQDRCNILLCINTFDNLSFIDAECSATWNSLEKSSKYWLIFHNKNHDFIYDDLLQLSLHISSKIQEE